MIDACINGNTVRALVDTGCTNSMLKFGFVGSVRHPSKIVAFDGREVNCKGKAAIEVKVGDEVIDVDVIIVEDMLNGVDLVLGLDAIQKLGGVTVSDGVVKFGRSVCALADRSNTSESIHISDKDFVANFDGKQWTIRWKWRYKVAPQL